MNSQIFLNGISIEQLAEALQPLLQPQQIVKPITANDLITRDEVCELLNIGKVTLWKHTKSGKLLSSGIGNRVLYSRKQVLEAVEPINH